MDKISLQFSYRLSINYDFGFPLETKWMFILDYDFNSYNTYMFSITHKMQIAEESKFIKNHLHNGYFVLNIIILVFAIFQWVLVMKKLNYSFLLIYQLNKKTNLFQVNKNILNIIRTKAIFALTKIF